MLRDLDETDKVVGKRLENLCKDAMIGGTNQELAGGAPNSKVSGLIDVLHYLNNLLCIGMELCHQAVRGGFFMMMM